MRQQQESLPLSTHPKDRGDTARVSKNYRFHRKQEAREQGFVLSVTHPSQISAAAFEGRMDRWVGRRTGRWRDRRLAEEEGKKDKDKKGSLCCDCGQ